MSASANRPEVPACLSHGGIGSVPGEGGRTLWNEGSRSRLIKKIISSACDTSGCFRSSDKPAQNAAWAACIALVTKGDSAAEKVWVWFE